MSVTRRNNDRYTPSSGRLSTFTWLYFSYACVMRRAWLASSPDRGSEGTTTPPPRPPAPGRARGAVGGGGPPPPAARGEPIRRSPLVVARQGRRLDRDERR